MSESPFRLNGRPIDIQPGDHLVFNKREKAYHIVRGSQMLGLMDPKDGERRYLPFLDQGAFGILTVTTIFQIVTGLLLTPVRKGEIIEIYIFQQPDRKEEP